MNHLWQKIRNMVTAKEDKATNLLLSWHEAAERAKLEWIHAHKYYENLTDSDLIDYAIYMILATERRYMYILRKIKSFEDKDGDNPAFVHYNKNIMTRRESDVYDSGF